MEDGESARRNSGIRPYCVTGKWCPPVPPIFLGPHNNGISLSSADGNLRAHPCVCGSDFRVHHIPDPDRHGGGGSVRLLGIALAEGGTVIRQVITCDICGTQKLQTNHWFVAYEESGELRISGWNSLRLLSPETKHLCGETCALKLTSHFLMKLMHVGSQPTAETTGAAPTAERAMDAREGGTGPLPSTWPGSHGSQAAPGLRDVVRLRQSHPCTGSRTL